MSPLSKPEAVIVFCAVPADFDAESLARRVVEARLAACVQIGQKVTSVYRWQGVTESTAERLLLIKTSAERFSALESAIRAAHPYEVPEIVAVPVSAGHAAYLEWLSAATS